MAHAARIEDGIVREVIVVPDDLGGDENDAAVEAYIHGIGLTGKWIRTSYSGNIRSRYAGIGYKYDEALDEFVAPEAPEEEPA
jgi:hypothetical protein